MDYEQHPTTGVRNATVLPTRWINRKKRSAAGQAQRRLLR